ncbi:MAG TPA: alpha/beta hydrolase-fold protein [Gaiellaceae bacterium]
MASLAAVVAAAALLPGFAPFSTGPDGGTVLSGVFPGTERAGYVYLPPGYDAAKRYPVLYLLHGMPGSPTEYLAGTDLTTFADTAISSGAVRPFIAVLPAAGPARKYNGEWAGPWETAVVDGVVPFVDSHLATIRAPAGRVIAGLSAGGFGAVYIGVRHPDLFGAVESWSGYFHPLRDGPFKDATPSQLSANDPTRVVASHARALRGVRFFVSSGPAHSHWFKPAQTWAFARELQANGLRVRTYYYADPKGEWRAQFDDGLQWAFGSGG